MVGFRAKKLSVGKNIWPHFQANIQMLSLLHLSDQYQAAVLTMQNRNLTPVSLHDRSLFYSNEHTQKVQTCTKTDTEKVQ